MPAVHDLFAQQAFWDMCQLIQDEKRLYGALYALRLLTRKYEFRDADERMPLDIIVKTTFPTLLQVFQVPLLGVLFVFEHSLLDPACMLADLKPSIGVYVL